MTPLVDQVLDEIQGAWRHRWLALATAAAVAIIGWTVIFALPDLYEADAKVFVDTSTALAPVLQGLAVQQDVDAQLNYVRHSLLAGPPLVKIARESGILPAVTDPQTKAQILDEFSHRIVIDVSDAGRRRNRNSSGTIYEIRYRDRHRARSLRVVSNLLNALVNGTLGGKQAGAQSAQKFLQEQIAAYGRRLSVAESRLAAFKKHNLGLLPTEQGGYFKELQTELTAVSNDEAKIQKARARRTILENQLHGNIAVAAAGSASGGANGNGTSAGSDINSLIAQAQAKLDNLELKFTNKYPDVIAAKQVLKELKARRAAEIKSLQEGNADAASVTGASSNPVYQSIEQQLNQTDLKLADLKIDLSQHRGKAAQLKKMLSTAPQVEAEYEKLTRDYAVNTAEYNALLAKSEKARLGEQAGNAGSVRFDVVQPPTAAFEPVWPHRARWIAAVLVVALALGAGLAYGLYQLHPTVNSATGLTQLTGVRVLGVVGAAFPQQALRAARRERFGIALAAFSFLVAFAVALALSSSGVRLSAHILRTLVNT